MIYLYSLGMNDREVYKYFITDLAKTDKKSLTDSFLTKLDQVEKDIVYLDSKSYYKKGSNNTTKLLMKYPRFSAQSLDRIKRKLKDKLFIEYIRKLEVEK